LSKKLSLTNLPRWNFFKLNPSEEITEALQQLNSPNERIRSQAALSLGWIGDSSVVAALIHVLKNDPSAKVRANAAMSLGQLGDEKVVDTLIGCLDDKDAFVRGIVIYSLGLMKAQQAIPVLLHVLANDPDKETRMAAADTLAQLDSPEVIKPLIVAYLSDPEKDVRDEALDSLQRLAKILNIPNLEALIEEEKQKIAPLPPKLEETAAQRSDPLTVDISQKDLERRRKDIIETIEEELPKLIEYAIHNEVIPFAKLCERFGCDEFTFEFALTKLIESKKINAKINPQEKSFVILKPYAELSEEAQLKLKLIRKKFGIEW